MSEADFSRKSFPWLRSGFDLEGYVGALAAWLVGILLGILWGPLFWIGFIAALVILFATRTAERTPPLGDDLIVSPTDGIVVSVAGASVPDELRLEGSNWTRVRVAVGPTKTNGIHAPMDGAIDHIIKETGDPAAFAAMKPDRPGLAVAYISFESGRRAVGVRLATGGLGPRLELAHEAGDAVRLGRNIGTLRLGGWCDIYLPAEVEITLQPGQTLVGSETLLGRFGGDGAQMFKPSRSETDAQTAAKAIAEPTDREAAQSTTAEREGDLTLEKLAEETSPTAAEPAEEEDVTEMFARLRKEARKTYDQDDT